MTTDIVQLDTLISVVSHADSCRFEPREIDAHGFDGLAFRVQNDEQMPLLSVEISNLEALTIRPRDYWLFIDFDLEAVSIELAVCQRWRLFKEGIIDASGNADAALLRESETGS